VVLQTVPSLVIAVLLLLFSSDAFADEPGLACDGSVIEIEKLRAPGAPALRNPPEEGRPVPVQIRLQITELNEIDERASSFRFEGLADFSLCDPRSAFDPAVAGQETLRFSGIDREDPVWNVNLHIANGMGAVEVTRRLIEIDADGSIRLTGYFNSRVASAFDLRSFPFDRQGLTIFVESFDYNNQIVELVSTDAQVSLSEDIYATEWHHARERPFPASSSPWIFRENGASTSSNSGFPYR